MYMKSFECIYMMYSVRYSSFMQIHAVPHISQNIPPIRDGSQPWGSPATAVPAAAASVFRTFSQLNVLNLVTGGPGGAWWEIQRKADNFNDLVRNGPFGVALFE